ncbi:hypothetical protein niasHT_015950 [Heterodera trifolii]|uniref:Deltamethrin resistance protein prag01 domain-containing protein n=1 Tax=Heterodera trifolii TaxID=157864 RepID=A0ABD2LCN8_9BILA
MLCNFRNFNCSSSRHFSLASILLQQPKFAAVASPSNKNSNAVLIEAIRFKSTSIVQDDALAEHGHDDHGHGHHAVNYGPPITYDYTPIPSQPYKKVYKELKQKFITYLAMSFVFFMFCCYVGYSTDVLGYSAWKLPGSYRNRKAINARLDAEEAKAKAGEGEQ